MPLKHLVEYFNQRIADEQGLHEPPLVVRGGQVEGRLGEDRLASEFHPIRRAAQPFLIVGHDATLQARPPENSEMLAARVFNAANLGGVVNLDRLCRTIHMLNYLLIAHEGGAVFLHVHPRHILGVKSDHGAYFEEVIFRCGLSPRRVMITVPIKPIYDQQYTRLLDGLKNYQRRGYATAVKFDEQAGEAFAERYCIEFLYRFTPDFVRFGPGFFQRLKRDSEERRSTSLLSVIHGLDTEILLEGVRSADDEKQAKALRASLVKGDYYERGINNPAKVALVG